MHINPLYYVMVNKMLMKFLRVETIICTIILSFLNQHEAGSVQGSSDFYNSTDSTCSIWIEKHTH